MLSGTTFPFAFVAAAAACLALGCTTTVTETRVVDAGSSSGSSGSGGSTTSTTSGSTGGSGGETGGSSAGATTGGGAGEGGGEDTGGETVGGGVVAPPLGTKCGVEDNPGLAIGEPCAEHADCETGYCYDEALWNEDGSSPHRFCTVACTGCTLKGNCNEWGKEPGTTENKCIPLQQYFINYHELQFDSVCLASCNTNADCAGMGVYSTCAKLAFGKTDDYGVVKICQPAEFPRLDADAYK